MNKNTEELVANIGGASVVLLVGWVAFSFLFLRTSTLGGTSKLKRCKMNLSQIGKAFILYKQDDGGHKKFPELDGSKFISALYFKKIISEEEMFICPASTDKADGNLLHDTGDINSSTNDLSLGNSISGATSYAGRKNKNQSEYPGLFTLKRDTTITPIASDDWQGRNHHFRGDVVNFLFADGHTDHFRINNAYTHGNNGYDIFKISNFPDVSRNLADPLTN